MQRAVAFYRDLLGLEVRYPAGLPDYAEEYWVELDTGVCTLALHAGGEARIDEDAPKIVFRVENVAAARAELITRGVALSEIRQPAPGLTVCDGVDPDGNAFSLEGRD